MLRVPYQELFRNSLARLLKLGFLSRVVAKSVRNFSRSQVVTACTRTG